MSVKAKVNVTVEVYLSKDYSADTPVSVIRSDAAQIALNELASAIGKTPDPCQTIGAVIFLVSPDTRVTIDVA